MFKGFNNKQQNGFPNLNFQGDRSAYGFSGVYFWLDAAFGLNTQTNLGAVSRWQPIIGRSAFEQATAGNQPRFILNDANYNNLPSVEAQDNVRGLIAPFGLNLSGQFTIAIVSKVNNARNMNGIIGVSSGSAFGIHDGGSGTGFNGFGFAVNNVASFQGTTESTNTRIKVISSYSVVVNGVEENTNAGFFQFIEYPRLFNIGGNTENLNGSIAEIVAYNFAMTSAQCQSLSNNLNTKYAIY